ncbi:MAG: hypothetical protein K1X78_07760 [Verrucomicrobiaceae bacterium]|nr:hypothetical protein [Verrucomicrobiaceae bacterium]
MPRRHLLSHARVKATLQRLLSTPAGKARAILLVLSLVEIAILLAGPDAHAAREKIKAFAAHPKDTPWEADVDLGIHFAAWINLALLLLAALTAKWWTQEASPFSWPPVIPRRAWFWPFVLLAVIVCTAARCPLASKSLWWDETWVIRQCSHGSWKPDKKNPDELKFTPTTWKRCAFYYQKPTNHVPMSLAQKASLTAWHKITREPKEEFTDLAARIPPLTASAVAVVMLACLLRRWGRPAAGIVAAVLLSLHPWHIRYGVDARAYALVVLLCISALYAATCLIESRGRVAWHWVWLGLNQFLWLWAFPSALVDVAVMFALLAWISLRQEGTASDRWAVFSRLAITHVFAAMLLLQMFLPNFMQARHWAGAEAQGHGLDPAHAVEAWQQLATGFIPGDLDLVGFSADAVRQLQDSHGGFSSIASRLTGPVTLVALFGILVFAMQRRKAGSLVLGLVASGLLFAAVTYFAKSYFYSRFAIAMLVPFVIGLAWTTTQFAVRPVTSAVRSLIVVAAIAAQVILPQPFRRVLWSAPYAPLRDVAAFLENQSNTTHATVLCYGLGQEALPVYCPRSISVNTAAEIESALQKAKAGNRPVYLVQGYNTFNRAVFKDGFRVIDDPKLFEEVAWFPSIDPEFYFRVLKAR